MKKTNKTVALLLVFIMSVAANKTMAHALWIETALNGKIGSLQHINVFYGEYAHNEKEAPEKWFSDLKDCKLWIVEPSGNKKELQLELGTGSMTSNFTPDQNGVYTVYVSHLTAALGGTTKYTFLSSAHIVVGNSRAAIQSLQPLQLFTVDPQVFKVFETIKIKVLSVSGNAAGKQVVVASPEGWEKQYIADKEGYLEVTPLWKGRYVIEVTDFEKTKGVHNGKDFSGSWQGATYSFTVE